MGLPQDTHTPQAAFCTQILQLCRDGQADFVFWTQGDRQRPGLAPRLYLLPLSSEEAPARDTFLAHQVTSCSLQGSSQPERFTRATLLVPSRMPQTVWKGEQEE